MEPVWSVDPALTLSSYDSEGGGDEVQSSCSERFIWISWIDGAGESLTPSFFFFNVQHREEQQDHGEMADTDCTWISHSLLHGRGEHPPDKLHSVSGEYQVSD